MQKLNVTVKNNKMWQLEFTWRKRKDQNHKNGDNSLNNSWNYKILTRNFRKRQEDRNLHQPKDSNQNNKDEIGLVLWHINPYRLFNAKSSLYIYIKYIWFGLAWFYDISTL